MTMSIVAIGNSEEFNDQKNKSETVQKYLVLVKHFISEKNYKNKCNI